MGILLAYESFGDYIGETVPQLIEKTDAVMITLTGKPLRSSHSMVKYNKHWVLNTP